MQQDTAEEISQTIQSNTQHNKKNSSGVKHSRKKGASKESGDVQILRKLLTQMLQPELHSEIETQRASVQQNIAPLNNKHLPIYTAILKESVTNTLSNSTKGLFKHSVEVFSSMIRIFRECSVNTPILIATYQQFQKLWLYTLKNQSKEAISLLLPIWKEIPYQILPTFLTTFDLYLSFQQISIEQFLKYLTISFFEGRVQQTCEYYLLYKINRKSIKQQLALMKEFQLQQIIPRITKKDQLFAEYVLSILKRDESISRKVYEVISIEEEEKLVGLVGDDIKKHPKVIHRALMRQYRDIVGKQKKWYIIQDKLSFSPTYLRWYSDEITGKQIKDDESEGQSNVVPFSSTEQAQAIAQSILFRCDRSQNHRQVIKNPLYQFDDFIPAQLLLQKLGHSQTQYSTEHFLTLEQEKVIFIDKINQTFEQACKSILLSCAVGFDTQFRAVESKFEEGGVSIIQLATKQKCYIFDYHNLRKQADFINFFVNLMENEKIIKIGHTVTSDLQHLYKNFEHMQIKGMVDLTHIVKKQFPNQIYTSLAYMTDKFLHKKMCKYQQRSNWSRRPLKKTQIYYAALDAFVCLAIYNQLPLVSNSFAPQKMKLKISQSGRQSNQFQFDDKKFAEYLKNPIFLVDNMLKKLSSTMRNCGIDAEYISVKDYELAISQAKKQKRIILTRDSRLAQRKNTVVPIYLISEKSDIDLMFTQILQVFKLDLQNYSPLSRCVKCNNQELIVICSEQAQKEINFLYSQSLPREFWRCSKCKQIYWEGGQFQKAKKKFNKMRNNSTKQNT